MPGSAEKQSVILPDISKVSNWYFSKKKNLYKDTIGINKKLQGEDIVNFYCMDCLADYLGVTVDELLEKIEQFKTEGCKLFS